LSRRQNNHIFQRCSLLCTIHPGPIDIAILGGGILGSATAYFLLKESPGLSICVIEPDPTYEFASTLRASGGCRVQFTCPENIAMSLYSIGFIKAFEQTMASHGRPAPVDWVEGGYLFIVPPDNVANLERNVERQRSEGCVVDLLTPRELKSKFPCCDRQRQNGSPLARG
jgi:FAD-dependent oxidoreductase domain-containing protein 1